MGLIIDIIIVGIVFLSTFLAYRKGLVALAIKLFAVIAALIVTLLLYRPISNLIINTTSIDETIQNAIYEKEYEIFKNENPNNDEVSNAIDNIKTGAIQQSSKELSIQIINISVILVLFFGLKIAFKFITVIAEKIKDLPIIGQFDKLGGIIYGIARGILLVYTVLLLISFSGQIDSKNTLHKDIESSNLGKMMYENNILKTFI